jgi:hypothetical protein
MPRPYLLLGRSGAAKLHLEGMAKQLPQGGSQATGQPAAVVTLALKRITHLRQAVFKVKGLCRHLRPATMQGVDALAR